MDALLAAGTIGGDERNAADFQIATTVRAMLACADLEPVIAGRAAEAFARNVWPDYPHRLPPVLAG